MYKKVSAVIDKVLLRNGSKLPEVVINVPQTALNNSTEVSKDIVKLVAKYTNGGESPVKSPSSQVPKSDVVCESPKRKSGRKLVKSKHLISTKSGVGPNSIEETKNG